MAARERVGRAHDATTALNMYRRVAPAVATAVVAET